MTLDDWLTHGWQVQRRRVAVVAVRVAGLTLSWLSAHWLTQLTSTCTQLLCCMQCSQSRPCCLSRRARAAAVTMDRTAARLAYAGLEAHWRPTDRPTQPSQRQAQRAGAVGRSTCMQALERWVCLLSFVRRWASTCRRTCLPTVVYRRHRHGRWFQPLCPYLITAIYVSQRPVIVSFTSHRITVHSSTHALAASSLIIN